MTMTNFIDHAIHHRINFATYRLPGDHEMQTIVAESPIVQPLATIKGRGFVVHPFAGLPVFLPADYYFSGTAFSFDQLQAYRHVQPFRQGQVPNVMTRNRYMETCRTFMETIKSGQLTKAILSRVILRPLEVPVGEVFSALSQAYPEAFVYLLHLDRFGTWIGATPERLIKTDGNYLHTVALAGTQPTDRQYWTAKERDEQAYVSQYILEVLQRFNCREIDSFGPVSVAAGPVAHLSTRIRARYQADIYQIIAALHPTPAVCGIPKEEAKAFILKHEGYHRGFYTGFLGPVGDDVDLYVNLRCMQVFGDQACIYVGSGITDASNPAEEWMETVLKSQTLLAMIEGVKC